MLLKERFEHGSTVTFAYERNEKQMASLTDNRENKLARMEMVSPDEEISRRQFNMIMGATLLWGVVLDFTLALNFSGLILQLPLLGVVVGYLVVSIACMFVIYGSDNPVVSFLGFTGLALAMGVLLVWIVQGYTAGTVAAALAGTGIITVLMMGLSTAFPEFFKGLGKMLFIALIGVIVFELVAVFAFGYHSTWIDVVVLLIFCGYIGYDWAQTQAYVPTVDRAIDSAADIFVDIVNVFIRLLMIFGNSRE